MEKYSDLITKECFRAHENMKHFHLGGKERGGEGRSSGVNFLINISTIKLCLPERHIAFGVYSLRLCVLKDKKETKIHGSVKENGFCCILLFSVLCHSRNFHFIRLRSFGGEGASQRGVRKFVFDSATSETLTSIYKFPANLDVLEPPFSRFKASPRFSRRIFSSFESIINLFMVFFHIAPLLEGRKEKIENFIVTLRERSEKKASAPCHKIRARTRLL
jgi:hypothetical protein